MDNREIPHIEEIDLDSTLKKPQPEKSVFSTALKGIALVVGLFFLGNLIGSLTNIQKTESFQTQYNTTSSQPTAEIPTTLTEAQTTTATAVSEAETSSESTEPSTTLPTTTKDTTPDTKEEILELFNKSSAKIKKKATRVICNYEDYTYNEELSDYPAALNIVVRSLINKYLVKDDIPKEYTDAETIRNEYPVKGKSWVSKLTVSDIASAECKEKKGKYEIVLRLLYSKDPEESKGVAAVMNPLTLEDIQEKAPIVKECSVEYYDCTVSCTIEKKSGNMIYAKYTQPTLIEFTSQGIRERQGVFAFTSESEYVIEY